MELGYLIGALLVLIALAVVFIMFWAILHEPEHHDEHFLPPASEPAEAPAAPPAATSNP